MIYNRKPRGSHLVSRYNRKFPKEALDFKPLLHSLSHPPRIDFLFGAKNIGDKKQVKYIADIPHTTLHPIDNCSEHNLLYQILGLDSFTQFLDEKIQ